MEGINGWIVLVAIAVSAPFGFTGYYVGKRVGNLLERLW